MGSKPAGTSGASTIARYFAFRWAYLFLSFILLCVLMSLLFIGNLYYSDAVPWWSPSFLIYSGWPGWPGVIGETAASRLHGFLGLDFDAYGWRRGPAAWWIQEPLNIAAIVVSVLLIVATALFIIPAQGSAKNLPASRPIPLRGRITAALVNGFIAAALFAGIIETTGFDVIPVLDKLGWLVPAQPQNINSYGYYYPPPDRLMPTWGIWSMASWLSTSLIALPVAPASIGVGIFWPPPRDRYWQTERRTLIYTVLGLAMIAASSALCDDDPDNYTYHEHFLGGWFSVWLVGWWVLTWAWLSRTALFFMLRRHDLALTDPDNPACFACGYNLRGSIMAKQTKCPECGTPISERLMAVDFESA
ncbi:hypothetical protein OT109_01065 [Phycisphaeraceae bacterium D3-23]